MPSQKPNVLYIISHDQGIAAGCYAGSGPNSSANYQTPNIDRIAKAGTMLTSHFCTAPQCSPARGSLMTSQVPHMNGLDGLTHRGFKIDEQKKTVVQHFADNGYKTFLVGLEHETHNNPRRLGYQNIHIPKAYWNCTQLENSVEDVFSKIKDETRPWWVSIGTKEVHLSWKKRGIRTDPSKVKVPGYLPDTQKVRKDLADFEGTVKYYDEFIGFIMENADSYGLLENTIIIITTDHGIALPRAKGTLYDPGIQTMMIYSHPSMISRDQKRSELISSVDFAPTICDLCNVPIFEEFTGQSYAKLLKKDTQSEYMENEFIFAEKDFHDIYDPMRCVRTKKYKYIRNYEPQIPIIHNVPGDIQGLDTYSEWVKKVGKRPRAEEELYDLENDPLELKNLLENDPNHPILGKLRAKLKEFQEKTNDPILKGKIDCPKNARIDNADDFEHLLRLGAHPSKIKFFRKLLKSFKSIFSK